MRCDSCGYELGPGQTVCSQCERPVGGHRAAPLATTHARPFVERYRDAYRVSAFLTTLGDTVKAAGVVIGILMLLVGLGGVGGAAGLFGGLMLGAVCGGLFFLCGIVIAAQGQLLRASLDSAVCGSRFMSDSDCLAAMGMPESTFAARQPV